MNVPYHQAAAEFREAHRQWTMAVRAVRSDDGLDPEERRRLVAEVVRRGVKAHFVNMERMRALERITNDNHFNE